MQHVRQLTGVRLRHAWVTIGAFDGLHLGHQALLRAFVQAAHAAGAPAVALTFYPHPSVVLGNSRDPFYLMSPGEKAAFMEQLGVDVLITHPFNRQVAAIPARDFLERLKAQLGLRCLWVGYDFALGRNREGDIPTLRRLGQEMGFTLRVMDPVVVDGEVVSSTRIRRLLAAGAVEQAARLLGRPYAVPGRVRRGDGRGRRIGIPTANLQVWSRRMVPAAGVYVARAHLADGRTFGAAVNIGVRPTFEIRPVPPRVEAHLLGFTGDLYGQPLILEFLHRLREERRFPSVEALVAQIRADILAAEEWLRHAA